MKGQRINRRQVLKGVGAIGVVGALGIPTTVFADDDDDHGREARVFTFVSFSQAPTVVGGVQHRIAMQGHGHFRAEAGNGKVSGRGSYVNVDQASPIPKTLLSFGKWEAEELLSYDTKGLSSYGNIQPSILTIRATLLPQGAEEIVGVTLELICNVGALGAAGSTGVAEGFNLTIPGAPEGTYVPLSPAIIGITHISTPGGSPI